MLNIVEKILGPIVSRMMKIEHVLKFTGGMLKKNFKGDIKFLRKFITLPKLVLYSLIAVFVFYFFGIEVSKETLYFMKKELFFIPLSMVIPFLLGAAMFAVPQRTPMSALATIGLSVVFTYLLSTIFSSSLGYYSVELFDTHKYLAPFMSEEVTGKVKDFKTDFTLLYIIGISLVVSVAITVMVRGHHKVKEQFAFVSLFVEKLAYMILGAILWLMPFAVFASILGSIQTHGLDKLSNLGKFVGFVNIPQVLYIFILMLLIKIVTGSSLGFVFKGVKRLAKVAVPTSSSAATIMTNVETARTFPILPKYKHKGYIASILPFGATVNMDGTAMFITIMCTIGAKIAGVEIGFWDIIPYAVAYSCAAAAVPSASIVLITAIYSVLGIGTAITVQILGLMIAVDWINDRVRTLINVVGDLFAILASLNEKSPLQLFIKLFKRG